MLGDWLARHPASGAGAHAQGQGAGEPNTVEAEHNADALPRPEEG